MRHLPNGYIELVLRQYDREVIIRDRAATINEVLDNLIIPGLMGLGFCEGTLRSAGLMEPEDSHDPDVEFHKVTELTTVDGVELVPGDRIWIKPVDDHGS